MITITPQGQIYLCKTPLENDYKNQLTFSNATSQLTYFSSKVFKTLTEYTYIKQDNVIKVGYPIDEIIDCNYLYYQNGEFSNKYYFCFITKMEYVNENCTRVYFEVDVWQTYQFNIVYNSCFVEREHVNDDTIGKHTIPENLETGETIQVADPSYIFSRGYMTYVCLACTEVATNTPNVSDARTFNGIYSGLYYLIFWSASDASRYIHAMDGLGKADAINSVFLIPTDFDFSPTWYTATIEAQGIEYSFKFSPITESSNEKVLANNETITIPTKLGNNYVPKNNKLFTWPYNYFYISNHVGSDVVFRYEDFLNNSPSFKVIGAITPGCSIKCIPLNYKNTTDTSTTKSYNYGINGGKYPICSWNSDVYTNWLTQNGVNIGIDILTSATKLIGGMAIGDVGLTASGTLQIANTLAEVYQHSLIPDQVKGNVNSGDITYSSQNLIFTAYKMSIRDEYAKIIDQYFSAYGYKVNTYKVPNITGRLNWNYVKTIECNFEGDIPQIYLQRIKQIFNEGITFWHDPTKMYDYTQTNTIVS